MIASEEPVVAVPMGLESLGACQRWEIIDWGQRLQFSRFPSDLRKVEGVGDILIPTILEIERNGIVLPSSGGGEGDGWTGR